MNTYDFDQTIFNPDSSYAFIMFCLRRRTGAVLRALPGAALAGLLHLGGWVDTKTLKEKLFSFLRYLEDVDGTVAEFWAESWGGIEEWYLRQKREDDVIISASPEFLLRPAAEKLGVRLIATPMDKNNGRIIGANCHDEEKVRRFYGEYPDAHTENFYSDSLSDSPMAMIADSAFLVKKGSLSPWPGKQYK